MASGEVLGTAPPRPAPPPLYAPPPYPAPPPGSWDTLPYGASPPGGPWPHPWPEPSSQPPSQQWTPPSATPPAPARPRRRRLLIAGAAVVAAVAVAVPGIQRVTSRAPERASSIAAGTSAVPAAPGSATGARDVAERLLATMTGAVTSGNQDAFTSAAAPGRTQIRNRLREVFAGLRALPLASFELAVDRTRADLPASGPATGRFTLPAVATYRLDGWDSDPVRVPLTFVVDRVRGGWGIVEDRTSRDAGTARRLEPWLFPGLRVTSTAHVLVIGERSRAAQLRRLATTLERLVADVRAVWPERSWNGRVVVYATTSTAFVRSWYGRTAAGDSGNGDRASFVAKVATLRGAGGRPGAVRLVLTPYLLQGNRPGYVDILRHEMTHVATARVSAGVPVWLVEGAAEYTGFAKRTASGALDPLTTLGRHGLTRAEVATTLRGTWRPVLEAGTGFYRGNEASVDEHYNSAFITCLYIVDRYGEKTLRRLYERSAQLAGTSPLAGALVASTEKTALKEVLKTDKARLTKDVGAYATRLRQRLVFR